MSHYDAGAVSSAALTAGAALSVGAIPGALAPGSVAAAAVAAINANVLVLNRSYQAIRVINVRRAFSMLCRELAEVIHIETDAAGQSRWQNLDFAEWTELSQLKHEFEPDGHDWIKTVRYHVAVPRIIRLLGYDKLPKQDVKFNRRNIYARDGNKCQYCGRRFATTELSLDHVVPKSQGGKASWTNIVCCCVRCNVKKGGRTPEQAHMGLITKPVKPRRSPVISIKLADERYRSWKQFLDTAYWTVELK